MQRLRILQIFSRYLNYGGEEGSVYRIGDALQEHNDVEYFLSSTAALMGSDLLSRLQAPVKAVYNAEIVRRLERYQQAGRFDAWQIHNVFPGMSPAVYTKAFQLGVPLVHYLHNYRMSCVNGFFLNHGRICQKCIKGNFTTALLTGCWHESRLQSGYMGMILRLTRELGVFEKVALWIAISEAQKREHVRMGIPEGKIHVIHHFYDPSGPVLPPAREGHALFVGRLSGEKGVFQLLEAWRELRSGGKKLFIVGDGPERARLENHARRRGLEGVVFTGFLNASEQKKIWEQALFSVVPSVWFEPFGMTVLEAWAMGRPVVANNTGAMPELISHGSTGLLVDVSRPHQLAEAMDGLFARPDEAVVMGLEGRRVLESRFNRKVWLEKMDKLYQRLYPEKRRG